jgi:hypothetical protein
MRNGVAHHLEGMYRNGELQVVTLRKMATYVY